MASRSSRDTHGSTARGTDALPRPRRTCREMIVPGGLPGPPAGPAVHRPGTGWAAKSWLRRACWAAAAAIRSAQAGAGG
ncbi:MAG: hypothetical protein ABJB47_05570 [Actinomycetota bacterium]